jgi:hypothetical protein
MTKINESLLFILEGGERFGVYGIPDAYVKSLFPDFDFRGRKAVHLSEVEARVLLDELAYVFGYRLEKE